MAEYIERKDALKEVDHSLSLSEAYSRIASRIIAADVVEVVPELREVVKLLHDEYEMAKQLDFVYDPLAYAVYQTWDAVSSRRMDGK